MGNENLNKEEVLLLIEDFNIEPLFDNIIITVNKEEQDYLDLDNQIIDEDQYVVAIGTHVNSVSPGDKVKLNLDKMSIKSRNPNNQDEIINQIKIDPILYKDRLFAIISDRYLKVRYK